MLSYPLIAGQMYTTAGQPLAFSFGLDTIAAMSTVALRRQSAEQRAWRLFPVTFTWLGAFVLAVLLFGFWRVTAKPILVTVDGLSETLLTQRRTVGDLLLDLGILVHPADRITPALSTRVTRQMAIRIERARPVRIFADGRDLLTASWGQSPRLILQDAGIVVNEHDRVVVDGHVLLLDATLLLPAAIAPPSTYQQGYAWDRLARQPLQIRLQRAVPLQVQEGGLYFDTYTTAQTVGEALRQAQIILYLGDQVQPSLGSPISPGLHISIQRSLPIRVQVGGRTLKTRTRAKTVAGALAEMGVGLSGLDRVEPALDARLAHDIEMKVTRVFEEIVIKEKIVPFETVFQADPNLPIDTQEMTILGADGITRERYRLRYEDGQEVSRLLEDTWVAQEPTQRVIAYGQLITPQTLTAEDGAQITYWRKVRMYASSYSAGTAGVATGESWYGRTYTGDPMRKGIVAVDPRIIPLRSKVYVPVYGYGDALDVGSAIRSKRIDLGYDDDNLVLWNRWVDVYLLWPPPPAQQITWVIPNYPREPN